MMPSHPQQQRIIPLTDIKTVLHNTSRTVFINDEPIFFFM